MFSKLLAMFWFCVYILFNPITLAVLCILAVWFYNWYTRNYGLWKKLGVPGPKPKFPFGSSKIPFVNAGWEIDEFLYKHADRKFCGYIELMTPVLYVADPELIQSVTIKDFDSFINRRDLALSEEFKGVLSILKDKEWKETRSVMTPSFSASKLKGMHDLCLQNSKNMLDYIEKSSREVKKFECKDAFGRFTMDNIALCAFGVNCNSFTDPNTEFAAHATKIFDTPSFYGYFHLFVLLIFPTMSRVLPDPSTGIFKFFSKVVTDAIRHREKEGSTRRDFLQLMIDTKDKDGNRILSDRSILDQSVLFFIAGYDTTATLLTFTAFSLAVNQDIQAKVQKEIDTVIEKYENKITYEAVVEMTYLDRVISETLRLYSPAVRGEREAKYDYTLPGTDVVIPKGTVVQFPIYPLHRDEQYYPEPLKFDPDRFLPEVKESRHPCTYVPFGSGPRNCIAMRFALFEAKVALVALMKEFELIPTRETPALPLKFGQTQFLLTPEGGKIFLNAVRRNPLNK